MLAVLSARSTSVLRRSFSTSLPKLRDVFPLPLKHIKVVDLTRVLAGPYATQLLADLGASVVKIEEPRKGDDTRQWSPPGAALQETEESKANADRWDSLPPESAYFLSVNRNKRSLGLNIKSEKGKEIVKQLVKEADVLVENYLPGKLAQLGLGYEDCKAINPKLVYASISGYGQTGPFSRNPGYDVMIQAEAGLMHITGEADGSPVKTGVALTDLTTGLYTYSAILAALYGREQTGEGAWIDASLFDCQIASLANIASSYLVAGQEAKRHGTAHPSIVPYQTFPTKDGYIMLGAGNDGQFRTFCKILDHAEWSEDSRFNINSQRVANRSELIALINEALSVHTTAEWLERLSGKGIPLAPINNIQQTFEHPQAKARQVTAEVNHARAGPIQVLSPPIAYNGQKLPVTRPPPVLGQHTDEILGEELGFSEAQIADLRKEGVI